MLGYDSVYEGVAMNLFDIEPVIPEEDPEAEEPPSPAPNGEKSSVIIVPRTIVRGRMTDSKTRTSGSSFVNVSKNSVQIADVAMMFAQQHIGHLLDEQKIWDEAEANVRGLVKKYSLDDPSLPKGARRKNERYISSMINHEVREIVSRSLAGQTTVAVDFEDFLSHLHIQSLYSGGKLRLAVLNKIIKEARSRAVLNYRLDVPREENGELIMETHYKEFYLIPAVNIVVQGHEGDGERFETFDDLARSRKKDKHKFIKRVEFTFNPEALAVIAFPRMESGYALTDRKERVGFGKYAFQLDWIVRSIMRVQENMNLNYYPIDELQTLFGVSYARYRDFKKAVLLVAIREINKAGAIFVEMKEHKEGRKVVAVSFRVSRNFEGKRDIKSGWLVNFSLSYFIAVRHYYSTRWVPEPIEREESFEQYLVKIRDFAGNFWSNRGTAFTSHLSDMNLGEWKELYDRELGLWSNLCGVCNNNHAFFQQKGMELSNEKLGIVYQNNQGYVLPFGGGKRLELVSEQIDYFVGVFSLKEEK